MNKRKMILSTAVVLGGLALGTQSILAYQGDSSVVGPNCTSETHEVVNTALESGDYDTWRENVSGNGRIMQVITEDNFAQFAEAHRLTLEGKTDEAQVIRAELGLGQGNRNGDRSGQGVHNGLRDGSGQGMQRGGGNNR